MGEAKAHCLGKGEARRIPVDRVQDWHYRCCRDEYPEFHLVQVDCLRKYLQFIRDFLNQMLQLKEPQPLTDDYVERHCAEQFFSSRASRSMLSSLDIELTERCNNDCIHCSINLPKDDENTKKKEVSCYRLKDIIREAAGLGCMLLRFTGGEPLLRGDFEELYIFARGLGLRVVIFTNAALITPRLARIFAAIPPLEKIDVSLYGMNRSSYEAVTRSPGSFKAAMRGVRLLINNKVPFAVKGVLLSENVHQMGAFEKWACGLTGKNNELPPYSMFFDLRCRRDSEEKNCSIRQLRFKPYDGVALLKERREGYFKGIGEFCHRLSGPCADKLFSCNFGVGSACVDSFGNLQGCLLLRHPDAVYDLSRGTLKDALTNFFPKLRMFKAANEGYLSRCARCFLKGLCEMCPAKSWMEHGALDEPVDYLCEIAHAQAEALGLLEKSEKPWEINNWQERIERLSLNKI